MLLNLLSLAKVMPQLNGYFIDPATNDIYSTKSSPTSVPVRLKGTVSVSTGRRTFTLSGRPYTHSYLIEVARPHINKLRNEQKTPSVPVGLGTPRDRSHAANVTAGLTVKGVVIAQVAKHNGEDFLMFGSKPTIHTTEQSWRAEMTRLATTKPGTKFVAFKVDSTLVSGGLQWD